MAGTGTVLAAAGAPPTLVGAAMYVLAGPGSPVLFTGLAALFTGLVGDDIWLAELVSVMSSPAVERTAEGAPGNQWGENDVAFTRSSAQGAVGTAPRGA